MEEVAAQLKKRKKQKQLEGVHEVIDQLRDCDIEAQRHCQAKAKDCR